MSWFFDPLKPCGYNVILADPPTRWSSFTPFDSEKGPGYPTMSDAWLRELPVGHLAAGDCLLWLWTTMPQLKMSLDLMYVWGFRFVTAGSWHKQTVNGKTAFGTGKVLQSAAEVFLIGAKGKPPYARRPVRGVIATEEEIAVNGCQASDEALAILVPTAIAALRREHSRKPDEQYTLIETLMGDVPRCELFARSARPGWDSWGNETDKFPQEGA